MTCPGPSSLSWGEAPEQGDVDGGDELIDHRSLDAEPFGGGARAARVEPLRRLQPVAEATRVLVDVQVFQDEAEGTGGLVVTWELMVVEVQAFGFMTGADVDDRDFGVVEFFLGGITTQDADGIAGDEDGASEEVVLMRPAGVGDDVFESHKGRGR